jgi:hypothetical protein
VLTRRPAENPAAFRITELGLEAFADDGFSLEDAVRAVRAVSLAVLGLALNECPPMGDWVEPVAVTPTSLTPFPRLAAAAEVTDAADDGHWSLLVEALMAGLGRGAPA